MANITVDLSEKACRYVEDLYSVRADTMHTCERLMDYLKDHEHDEVYMFAKGVYETTRAEIEAVCCALSALHLTIDDGRVFSDGWPSNFNRIRHYINSYEGTNRDGAEAFRAVLSAFGFIYYYDKDAGVIIRYTSRPED